MSAPKVLAKGAGEIALRIRQLGAEYRIPLFEAPPMPLAVSTQRDWATYPSHPVCRSCRGAGLGLSIAPLPARRRYNTEKPENLPVPEALDFSGENNSDG